MRWLLVSFATTLAATRCPGSGGGDAKGDRHPGDAADWALLSVSGTIILVFGQLVVLGLRPYRHMMSCIVACTLCTPRRHPDCVRHGQTRGLVRPGMGGGQRGPAKIGAGSQVGFSPALQRAHLLCSPQQHDPRGRAPRRGGGQSAHRPRQRPDALAQRLVADFSTCGLHLKATTRPSRRSRRRPAPPHGPCACSRWAASQHSHTNGSTHSHAIRTPSTWRPSDNSAFAQTTRHIRDEAVDAPALFSDFASCPAEGPTAGTAQPD